MYRNPVSPSYGNSFQSYQTRGNSFSKTGTQFNQSRSPLYPIGPSLTQQQFHPVRRAPSPSPYITSKQGIKPPSYEQRHFRTQMGFMPAQRGTNQRTYNYQQREKRLIDRNQIQIQEQQKRRQMLRTSYEREIENIGRLLNKNLDRKQKLLLQIQVLQNTNQEYHQRLSSQAPPKRNVDFYQPIDRKQQDIILTKNKLLTDIRQKQEGYLKQEEEEQQHWQSQIKQKQKVLFKTEQTRKNRRMQLIATKLILQKPDYIAIEDEVRQSKYHDFLYDAKVIEDKIQNLIKQRQQQHRQIDQSLKVKRQNIHSLLMKHEQKSREAVTSRMRIQELQRVSKQMQSANQNLLHEFERKQKMIQKYELDIHSLKQSKDRQQGALTKMMRDAREDYQQTEMQHDIEDQITKVQQQLRHQSSINNGLRTQYQKLYELICSTATKNIHETFNQTVLA